jgi:hypothetical protein
MGSSRTLACEEVYGFETALVAVTNRIKGFNLVRKSTFVGADSFQVFFIFHHLGQHAGGLSA